MLLNVALRGAMDRIRTAGGIGAGSLLAVVFGMAAPAWADPSCTTGSGLGFCMIYGSSVSAQAAADFTAVAQSFSNALINTSASPIDINVQFGSVSGGDVSTSNTATNSVGSFANVVADLAPAEKSLGYVLPSIDPTGAGTWYMPQAEAKVLGVSLPNNASASDGTITFSSATSFSYVVTVNSGQYSFQAAAAHEIEEVLGRTSTLNNNGALAGVKFADTFDL
ncbi:MAG TPA: hypothetical protein VGF36_05760, partial [Rhodopila sp.]